MFRRIMVAIIRLCSYKGELNAIASSKWLDVEHLNIINYALLLLIGCMSGGIW